MGDCSTPCLTFFISVSLDMITCIQGISWANDNTPGVAVVLPGFIRTLMEWLHHGTTDTATDAPWLADVVASTATATRTLTRGMVQTLNESSTR